MLRAGPVVGVRHGGYPEYLDIYRPGIPFLENTHALSGLKRRLYATRFTLRTVERPQAYMKCKFGGRHRLENRCRPGRESRRKCDPTHSFAMPVCWNLGYIFPHTRENGCPLEPSHFRASAEGVKSNTEIESHRIAVHHGRSDGRKEKADGERRDSRRAKGSARVRNPRGDGILGSG